MRILFLSLIFTFFSSQIFSQNSKPMETNRFMFVATSMAPMKGGLKLLNTPYDVTVKGDTLISFLPYTGSASSATPNDQNLRFTSYNVKSTVKDSRKGTQIELRLTDQNNTGTYSFFVLKNGTATLDVMSNFRDPVTYRGYIKPL